MNGSLISTMKIEFLLASFLHSTYNCTWKGCNRISRVFFIKTSIGFSIPQRTQVLLNAEKEKKGKYGQACEERRALFTPFCCSIDGMIGREGETFLKRLGDSLALKWDSNYSTVIGWIRARLNFGIL